MFKSVDYSAVEGHPDLKAKAERATSVLGGLMRDWRDEVEVSWRPAAPGSDAILELTLALALWNASGSATGAVRRSAFAAGQEVALRLDVREVLLNLSGELSRQQMKRLEEFVFEPAEV